MKKRFLLFGIGFVLGIMLLISGGGGSRLKSTFFAYLDYFNMDKRVITHLKNDNTKFTDKADCQLAYYHLTREELLSVLQNGEVNFDRSDKKAKPCQYYVVENNVKSLHLSVTFEFCPKEESVRVMNLSVEGKEDSCN